MKEGRTKGTKEQKVEGGTERKEELQGRRKTGRSKGRANK
jgi:hypothetical protein